MNKVFIYLIVILLVFSCQEDQGERLFELNYPSQRMNINRVLNTIESHFFIIGPLPNTLPSMLQNSSATIEDINRVEPFFATLTSEDGFELAFIQEISVRICNPEDPSRCDLEIFYLDNIPFNTGSRVELLPSLANLKEFFDEEDRIIMELVLLRLRNFSPANFDLRFDFAFDVRR